MYIRPLRSDELYHYGRLGMKLGQHIFGKESSIPGTKEVKLNAESLKRYKNQYRNLSHVKLSDNTDGRLYVDKKDKVVGMINTEKKSDGTWIQGLEVFGANRGKGIGTKLLDIAVKDLGATKLSVRNTNAKAKRMYDKYGFEEYDNDGFMSYMQYDKELYHHGILGQRWGVKNGPPYPLNAAGQLKATKGLIDILNSTWDYGVKIDGKKTIDLENVDWSRYRTRPVQELEKDKIGVCWDFTNYEAHALNSKGIPNKSYFYVSADRNDPDNVITHTFVIASIGDKNYWIESAKWNDRGVHEVNSYKDVINTFKKENYVRSNGYDVYEYNPKGMDKGLTDQEFFDRASSNLLESSSSELAHHGVKGQKWGVRRFQNPDGTLTEAGRKRRNVQSIVNTMSDKDMYYLGYDKKDIPYGRKNYTKDYSEEHLVQRFIAKQGKTPVAFLDLEEWGSDDNGKFLNAVVGTRSGDKYRGKGYASQAVKAGQKWFDEHKDEFKYTDINWGARTENKASQRLAEKHGFKKLDKQYEKGWYDYSYR